MPNWISDKRKKKRQNISCNNLTTKGPGPSNVESSTLPALSQKPAELFRFRLNLNFVLLRVVHHVAVAAVDIVSNVVVVVVGSDVFDSTVVVVVVVAGFVVRNDDSSALLRQNFLLLLRFSFVFFS